MAAAAWDRTLAIVAAVPKFGKVTVDIAKLNPFRPTIRRKPTPEESSLGFALMRAAWCKDKGNG
jgi:hypothetical protein